MFIPMYLNAPLVVGGLIAWFVANRSKDEALNKARFDRGTLIASGFIAGGALMGVVSAVLKYLDCDWKMTGWAESKGAEWARSWNVHRADGILRAAYDAGPQREQLRVNTTTGGLRAAYKKIRLWNSRTDF